jgi:quinolinate synthase
MNYPGRKKNAMTPETIYRTLKAKLGDVTPDGELRYKAELAYEINRLKMEKNALVLGHHYMEPALYHSIVDIAGDSLELSRAASQAGKDTIVFCGVRFMAETAKILNPEKTVLLPSEDAGCSLADGITAEDVCRLRAEFPGVPVVAYINTSAEVKAKSYICCTSSNAVSVVESLDAETVIFLPDEYLARNVAMKIGRQIIVATRAEIEEHDSTDGKPKLISWNVHCEVHERFSVQDIEEVRRQFSDVMILAHPECRPEVVKGSDFSGGTSAMIRFVRESKGHRFLLLTECSLGEKIAASFKDKEILRICSVRCPHMNRITLESTLDALRFHRYEIQIPNDVQIGARRALERMPAVH